MKETQFFANRIKIKKSSEHMLGTLFLLSILKSMANKLLIKKCFRYNI